MSNKDQFWNIDQVRVRLPLARSTIYQMIQEGKLKGVRFGEKRGLFVRESEVNRYISECEEKSE